MEVWDGDVRVAYVEKDTPRSMADLTVPIPDPKPWSPDSPHLYDLVIRLLHEGRLTDEIRSYAGMRSVALKDGWLHLNGEPTYLAMVLDQGYWPESYLAAPSWEALKADVEWVKRLGFNGVRKHQKIESPIWLAWCDRLGLLVWEEMPNARAWSLEAEEHLAAEWERAVRRDFNHPCIVAWVPVNESMGFPGLQKSHPGQYAYLERIAILTRRLDPERPVVDNDGWEHTDITDICAIHDYTPTAEGLRERLRGEAARRPPPGERLGLRQADVRARLPLPGAADHAHRGRRLPDGAARSAQGEVGLAVRRLRHDVLPGRPAAQVRGADGGHRLPPLRFRLSATRSSRTWSRSATACSPTTGRPRSPPNGSPPSTARLLDTRRP